MLIVTAGPYQGCEATAIDAIGGVHSGPNGAGDWCEPVKLADGRKVFVKSEWLAVLGREQVDK